ncbi:hypothetical protein D3C74_21300 [compost metagenome]
MDQIKNMFKQLDWKAMNISAWFVLIITYIYLIRFVEDKLDVIGFPFPFLTVYDKELGPSLFSSFHIDLGSLILNIAIVYLVITLLSRLYTRYKKS